MTPVLGVGISSVLGALLFLAAGIMIGRLRGASRAPSREREAASDQVEALRAGLKEKEEALELARRNAAVLEAQVASMAQAGQAGQASAEQASAEQAKRNAALEGRMAQLESERAGALQRCQQLELEVDTLTAESTKVVGADQAEELRQLRQELKQSHQQEKQGKQETQTKKKSEARRNEALEQALSGLKQERSKLLKQAQQLKVRLDRATADHDAQRDEVRELTQKLSDVSNREYAGQARLELMEQELGQAQDELRDLKRSGQAQSQAVEVQAQDQATELQRLRDALKQQQARVESAANRATQLEAELTAAQKELSLREGATQQVEEYKAQLLTVEGRLKQLGAVEEERFQLKQRVEELEQQVQGLDKLPGLEDERHELRLRVESLERQAKEADALREERTRLRGELDDALKLAQESRQQLESLEQASDDRTDMALRMNVLTEQVKEVEQLREENTALKALGKEADDLRQGLELQREENAALRSRGLVDASPPPPVLDVSKGGLAASMQALVNKIAGRETSRGAVIADDLGLVVSGTGEHTEELAALATAFNEIGSRANSLLPLAPLSILKLVDANLLTLAVQPLDTSSGRLILATLSVGDSTEREIIDQTIQNAATTLEGS